MIQVPIKRRSRLTSPVRVIGQAAKTKRRLPLEDDMKIGLLKCAALAAGLATMTSATTVLAQEAESGGAAKIVISADMLHEFIDFPFMDGRVVGGRTAGGYTVSGGGSGMLSNGEVGSIECLVNSLPVSGQIALISPCTMTASNGDMMFLVAARNAGTIGAGGGGLGVFDIVGGTGVFEGISGQGVYQTGYSDTDDNAVFARMEFELNE